MSYDSIEQWRQVATGQFNDWHPAFHTLNIWLVTRLWHSPAAVVFAQIAALSVLVGWTGALFRRLGTPPLIVWIILLLVALSPLNATMVITLWKDVPYSLALLTLTLLVLKVVNSDGECLDRRSQWIALGAIAALVALYRHNGPFSAFVTLALLALCYPGRWRPLIGALLIALATWLGVRGPFYRVIGVGDSGWIPYQPLIHQVAAHTAAGTPLSDEERVYLDGIRPVGDGWPYKCYWLYPTVTGDRFHPEHLLENPATFVQIWWRLTLRNPRAGIQHMLCSSTLVWWITPKGGRVYATGLSVDREGHIHTIDPNDLGLESNSLLPPLKVRLATWVTASETHRLSWLIWRPALYLYLLIAGALIMAVRSRGWRYLLVALPVVLHSIGLALATLGQESRFQYPASLVGLLVGGLSCFVREGAKIEPPHQWARGSSVLGSN